MNKKPFKFECGDKIYFIAGHTINKGSIIRVRYDDDKGGKFLMFYVENPYRKGDCLSFKEDQIFQTKAELIKYLESLDV